MSVEEARDRVARSLGWETTENDLDRLILEVQAEMPCYQQEEHAASSIRKDCAYWRNRDNDPYLCPSCAAREKLKVAV